MKDITEKGCGEATAVALGFFDGLHLGHIEVIKKSLTKALYNNLKSVIFTFNNNTMLPKFKTRQNIISYELKTHLLESIGTDYIFAPDFADIKDLSPEEFVKEILVKKLNAAYVSCGYDFRFAKGGKATAEDLKEICGREGIEVCIVPAVTLDGAAVSSTVIRELIKKGDVKRANEFLGYELTYCLKVIEGKQNGRKIGFPTINQVIPSGMVIPKFGVYKSWTEIDGHHYPSITNIGMKPTVALDKGEHRIPQMETYIIGFSGDLYGRKIKVVLREYMREEKRFDNMQLLAQQLQSDKKAALS